MELSRETPGAPRPAPSMPDLAGGSHAHTHTVHSALVALEALGVGTHRITLRRTGRDARPADTVVQQSPGPGAPVTSATMVQLEVAGLGFTQVLPVGMWDSGGEATAGTREILEPFDDPLEKLKHWFHEGAPLFRLAPDAPRACARWLALFGIDAEAWPKSLWYRLASLMANLPQLACSEEGCQFVLGYLLDLPVQGYTYRPSLAAVPEAALSRMPIQAARLGVDLLLGDTVEDLAMTEIAIGPVPLETYEQFVESEAGAELLGRVLEMVMPLSAAHQLRWHVEDRTRPPRLGYAAQNGRLGINSHMGAGLSVEVEAKLGAETDLASELVQVSHKVGSE